MKNMDGYNTVIQIDRERTEYISIVRKCIEAHHKQKEKQACLGFEWNDVGVWPVKLAFLATEYDFLEVTYKSNSATCYMVKDIAGAEKALRDIDAQMVATHDDHGIALKIWLSRNTMERLRLYLASKFSDQWDAESLIVERALNLFLDNDIVGQEDMRGGQKLPLSSC